MMKSDGDKAIESLPSNESKIMRESETQTSKTILQLASLDLDKLSTISLNSSQNVIDHVSNRCPDVWSGKPHSSDTNEYQTRESHENRRAFLRQTSPLRHHKTQQNNQQQFNRHQLFVSADGRKQVICSSVRDSCDETVRPMPQLSRFTIKEIRVKSVVRDTSNVASRQSTFESHSERIELGSRSSQTLEPVKYCSSESNTLLSMLSRIKNPDWNTALLALQYTADVLSESAAASLIAPHMSEINQRLIQLLQSPRSHVCRTSCQIAGQFFKTVRDTRGPEFDDIVDLLLNKTADSNKFIRIDANVALDSMVSHIPPFHAVKSICNKGANHKNDLVRIAAARLFVCIVVLCGADLILGHGANEFTRKRIVCNMVKFMNDRHLQTRHYGERLHEILRGHPNFQIYMKKLVASSNNGPMNKEPKLSF